MKIYIDNPQSRMRGDGEQELKPRDRVRFESKGKSFRIGFSDSNGSIEIYQVGDKTTMEIIPCASNKIIIV